MTVEERREAWRAYARTHRANNKEHAQAVRRAWDAKNREKINEQMRAWRAANPEKWASLRLKHRDKAAAQGRIYAAANKDKIRAYRAEPENKERHAKNTKRWFAEHPEKREQYRRDRLAKESAELEALAGRPRPTLCEVCGRPNQANRRLHFDHCHQRGHFRGWLCGGCNAALGHVNDDVRILHKLIAYLQQSSKSGTKPADATGLSAHVRRKLVCKSIDQ